MVDVEGIVWPAESLIIQEAANKKNTSNSLSLGPRFKGEQLMGGKKPNFFSWFRKLEKIYLNSKKGQIVQL